MPRGVGGGSVGRAGGFGGGSTGFARFPGVWGVRWESTGGQECRHRAGCCPGQPGPVTVPLRPMMSCGAGGARRAEPGRACSSLADTDTPPARHSRRGSSCRPASPAEHSRRAAWPGGSGEVPPAQ